MKQTIIVPQDVRCFNKAGGDKSSYLILSRTGAWIQAGTKITISEPQMMAYDHRDQLVVKVDNEDPWDSECDIYVIIDEIGNLNSPIHRAEPP